MHVPVCGKFALNSYIVLLESCKLRQCLPQ
ncbi:MAG: hypothetical protein ACLVD1_11230 [Lacrimispora saccharolytica]